MGCAEGLRAPGRAPAKVHRARIGLRRAGLRWIRRRRSRSPPWPSSVPPTTPWARCRSPPTPCGERPRSARSRTSPFRVSPCPHAVFHAQAMIKWAAATANEEKDVVDRGAGRRHPRRRRRGHRRQARRAVPRRRLPDRLGHLDQHERQRGHRQPRQAAAGRGPRLRRRAPQRPRQRLAVLQRLVPVAPCTSPAHARPTDVTLPGAARAGRGAAPPRPTSGRTWSSRAAPTSWTPRRSRSGRSSVATPARSSSASSGSSKALEPIHELAMGGTAVGTGLNCPPGFVPRVHRADRRADRHPVPRGRGPLRGPGLPRRAGRDVRRAARSSRPA